MEEGLALQEKAGDESRVLEAFSSLVQVWYAQLTPTEQETVMVGEVRRNDS